MNRERLQLRKILVAGAFVVLGVLGLGSCKTAQKSKTPLPEEPTMPQRDTIRPPYGEPVAMYGSPYRGYELKDLVPEE